MRRRTTTATPVAPELRWLAMSGRLAQSVAAAGDHDFAGGWLSALLHLAAEGVDERKPAAVRRLLGDDEVAAVEAEAVGFNPWCVTGVEPTGEAFAVWRRQFLAEHDYRGLKA